MMPPIRPELLDELLKDHRHPAIYFPPYTFHKISISLILCSGPASSPPVIPHCAVNIDGIALMGCSVNDPENLRTSTLSQVAIHHKPPPARAVDTYSGRRRAAPMHNTSPRCARHARTRGAGRNGRRGNLCVVQAFAVVRLHTSTSKLPS
jgi:hypothetical protein